MTNSAVEYQLRGDVACIQLDDGKAVGTRADDKGNWKVLLPAHKADGNAHTLTVRAANTITFTNVLLGDVWLCSGQSNMAMQLKDCQGAKDDIATADFPRIREITIGPVNRATPAADVNVARPWTPASPGTAGAFTGAGFYFARKVHAETGVPIGLLNASWSSSPIETWLAPEGVVAVPVLAAAREVALKLYAEAHGGELPVKGSSGAIAAARRKADAAAKAARKAANETVKRVRRSGKENVRKVKRQGDARIARIRKQGDAEALEVARREAEQAVAAAREKAEEAVQAAQAESEQASQAARAAKTELDRISGLDFERLYMGVFWDLYTGYHARGEPGQTFALHAAFNGMIEPLIPCAIKGVLWYQGEGNGGDGEPFIWEPRREAAKTYGVASTVTQRDIYFHKMQALIGGWRMLWDQGDFPFYVVQLASFLEPTDDPAGDYTWVPVREAQTKSLSITNTGMAVAIDVGEVKNIHPLNKYDVGLRLALWALAKDYGMTDLVYSGPLYKDMKIEDGKIRILFDHVGGGLMVGKKDGRNAAVEDKDGKLARFAVAGKDRSWRWAEAKIDGDTVLVWSDQVPEPVAVRYAWSMTPEGANLCNQEELPASPFRTDDWD